MKHVNWLVMFLLVLFLANCSEEPLITANEPDAVSTEQEALAKKGATVEKDQLIIEEEGIVDGPYFIPCLNGGVGDEVTFTVSYRYVTNIVSTPSGNQNYNGWIEEWSNEFTAASTGDHWVGSGIGHVMQTFKADGDYRAVEPLRETFENENTGEKLKLLWHFKLTPEVYSFEMISCNVLGPN